MDESQEFSFSTMNGECHVNDDSICFTYSQTWNRMERIFGKHSRRRSVVLAILIGTPLILLAIACFALGFWEFVAAPLIFGLVLLIAALWTLFGEEYSYPTSISRSDIRDISCIPPKGMRLSQFTITYQSEDRVCKTAFCLPCGQSPLTNYRERFEAYQAVTEAFVTAGLVTAPDS